MWIDLVERVGGRSGILAYHGIGTGGLWPVMHAPVGTLREQLEFVAARYNVVSLHEYVTRVRARKSVERCVAVTFDDAYAGVVHEAVDVLRDLGVPATIFVTVDAARKGSSFWWDMLYHVFMRRDQRAWEGLLRELDAPRDTGLDLPGIDVLRAAIMNGRLGRFVVPAEHQPGDPWRSATFPELREAARWDGLEFGVHTMTHPVLPLLQPVEQQSEIERAFEVLREELVRVFPYLAYPFGVANPQTARVAVMSGMVGGVTMRGMAPGLKPDPFLLPRIGVGAVHSLRSVRLRLARAMRVPLRLRKG